MAFDTRLRCGGEGGRISSNLKGAVIFSRHLAAGSECCNILFNSINRLTIMTQQGAKKR
jgi:hypothetical protein